MRAWTSDILQKGSNPYKKDGLLTLNQKVWLQKSLHIVQTLYSSYRRNRSDLEIAIHSMQKNPHDSLFHHAGFQTIGQALIRFVVKKQWAQQSLWLIGLRSCWLIMLHKWLIYHKISCLNVSKMWPSPHLLIIFLTCCCLNFE